MKLIKQLPPHLRDVEKFKELFNVDESMLKEALNKMVAVRNNNFVQTADYIGIEKFEELFNIVPDPNDTLEFRRFRVLNRMSMKPPFTSIFLRKKLKELLPSYKLVFDYDNYIMYIESYIENASYFNELNITLSTIKPCNIVVKYKPLIEKFLLINSETTYFNEFWNYKLDGSWKFDEEDPFYSTELKRLWNYKLNGDWVFKNEEPFAYEEGRIILKPKSMKSFTKSYLSLIVDSISKSITKVVLTNSEQIQHEITNFINNRDGVLEYSVPASMGNIINIKLYANDLLVEDYNTIWLSQGVDANIQHTIDLQEGVRNVDVKK